MLKKKSDRLITSETNKNDILKILGPPSTKSKFDSDIYIYIERKLTTDKLIRFGKQYYLINDVVVLEIDEKGILKKKTYYDLNNMNEIKLTKAETSLEYTKQGFVYDFLSSMRQKVNDPLGKRKRD
ncbi:hypothetical protein HIMB5_00006970 [alpha proteobacterium HIMB5]|nr:hypothetical protein HIMB5_00006970 [alpha proteobacterium HIMB5]